MRRQRNSSGEKAVPNPLDSLYAQTHGQPPPDPLDAIYAQTHDTHAGGASGSWDEPPNAMQRLGTKVQAGVEKVGGWGGPLSFLNPVGQVSGVAKGIMS